MSARDRAERVLTEVDLDALEAAGLRVIDEPEPPYDVVPDGPLWLGDGFAVIARLDGGVAIGTQDDATSFQLPPEVAAAISAAHVRGSEYR